MQSALTPTWQTFFSLDRPGKIVCVGLNYHDHAGESGMPVPAEPLLFGKFPNTLIGPGEPIVLPQIVPRDEVPDPHDLHVVQRVNGTLLQDGNTRDLIFDVPTLIAFASAVMTLEPGDLILTGTPPGVDYFRDPRIALQPGDTLEVEVEGIGKLTNPVVGGCGIKTLFDPKGLMNPGRKQ
ncbi:MAG: fumarylacetoacetate hydrolase family protein [Gaiellaceae bacterium]